ncbi:hypothetical protein [Listeria monocytogenes]|uniref:hypothetical protein n=1 Tax=Listeria monocytogenes TaxID=1639 RepID=UPI000874FCB4|nr:hypothetical protein [Listeria monocytogenes]OFF86553.1 hypothetical protein BJM62_06520 [Listeria monocytogenes]OFH62060.1 hypothetical protein BJM99_07040 [Listeria monocytogenes]
MFSNIEKGKAKSDKSTKELEETGGTNQKVFSELENPVLDGRIEGSNNSKKGVFEWIVEPNGEYKP